MPASWAAVAASTVWTPRPPGFENAVGAEYPREPYGEIGGLILP
ncbi:hypothetical protein ACQP1P_13610 [Dactylosporangium sp. CA-052675]